MIDHLGKNIAAQNKCLVTNRTIASLKDNHKEQLPEIVPEVRWKQVASIMSFMINHQWVITA
jgi:hypothetical protein